MEDQERLLKTIQENPLLLSEICDICAACEDVLGGRLDAVQYYMPEYLPPESLVNEHTFPDYRKFTVVRRTLEAVNVAITNDLPVRILKKVVDAIYTYTFDHRDGKR